MKIDVELHESEIIETELQAADEFDTDMEIGTITEGIDPDYEKMRNLPKFNGFTLIGDQTTAQLGIGLIGVYENENLSLRLR